MYKAVDLEEIIFLMKKNKHHKWWWYAVNIKSQNHPEFEWSKTRSSSDENWKQLCYIIIAEEEEKKKYYNMVNHFSWSHAAGRLSGGTYI